METKFSPSAGGAAISFGEDISNQKELSHHKATNTTITLSSFRFLLSYTLLSLAAQVIVFSSVTLFTFLVTNTVTVCQHFHQALTASNTLSIKTDG